jgi:hypothetical protein
MLQDLEEQAAHWRGYDVGNGGFCTINPSDPSCPIPQPTDRTTNANNSSCTSSCPTIALAVPCSPPPPSCTKDQHLDPSTNKCVPDNCSGGFQRQNGTCVRNLQPGNRSGDGG